ncbi:hypothetical protein [Reichenbachiella sp.]|uniref:hypothetical protein n=1 Tax=Reichenbachiella sp. TaxID=2184521 RepID=UPI003B59E8F1
MTNIFKTYLLIATLLICSVSCTDEELSKEEITKQKLTESPWGDPVVLVDGVDESATYLDFSIDFSDGTYTSENGEPIWASSGTWEFKDNTGSVMILDGDLEVTVNAVDAESLELALQWEQTTFELEGRTRSIFGRHLFFMRKMR